MICNECSGDSAGCKELWWRGIKVCQTRITSAGNGGLSGYRQLPLSYSEEALVKTYTYLALPSRLPRSTAGHTSLLFGYCNCLPGAVIRNTISRYVDTIRNTPIIELYINEDNARSGCNGCKTRHIVIPAKTGIQLVKQSPRSGQSRV